MWIVGYPVISAPLSNQSRAANYDMLIQKTAQPLRTIIRWMRTELSLGAFLDKMDFQVQCIVCHELKLE